MTVLSTPGQTSLDEWLPAFLTTDYPSTLARSTWMTLADIAVLGNGHEGYQLEGLAPATSPQAAAILPAGSRLRFLHRDMEMWGYGYLAAVWFVLEIETGELAGARLTIYDKVRWIAESAIGRATQAAAAFVPAEFATEDPSAELARRMAALGEIASTYRVRAQDEHQPSDRRRR